MPQISAARKAPDEQPPASPATPPEAQPSASLAAESFSLRSFDPRTKGALEQQAPEIRDVMDRARNMLLKFVPELKPILERPGMQVVVVDDINKAFEQAHGRPPGPNDPHPLEAFTQTTVDPKTKLATGTTIYLSSAMFAPQQFEGRELIEAVPRVIAALDHELQLCRQTVHPPNGQAVVDVSLGRREQAAYAGEIADLQRIYAGVINLDVRDYRKMFNRENLDGEKIVDEKVDFRFLAANLQEYEKRYAAVAAAEAPAAGTGAMPVLPTAGIRIPPGQQGGAVFVVPTNSPYYGIIKGAIDSGLTVATTGNPRAPFQIFDKDGSHLLRTVYASNHAKTPEQLAQVLALQLQAQNDMKELFALLKEHDWGFRALPHETGQPIREFEITERNPGAPADAGPEGFHVRARVQIQPAAQNSDVLEIGGDLYQAWESDLLKAVKKLIPPKKP